MAGNIFSEFGGNGGVAGVFAHEDALLPEFEPDELPHRERELSEIARALEPAARGLPAQNLFVFGPVGTGKTSAVKKAIKELEEYSGKARGVYVNCWHSDSRQAVFSDIAQSLGEAMPRRGIGSGEIFERVVQACRREGTALVVALDEADRVFAKGEEALLYDLGRARELNGAKISVVLVSNDEGLLAKADNRIRSSVSPVAVEFKKYSPAQLKDILRQRAKAAFVPGACLEETVAVCAAHGAKMGGDARIALEALWKAGRNADARGSRKVEALDARKSFETSGEWKKQARLAGASELEEAVLGALRENGPLSSGELLEKVREKKEITERGLRYAVDSLEGKKLLHARETAGPGGRGKTREIKLA